MRVVSRIWIVAVSLASLGLVAEPLTTPAPVCAQRNRPYDIGFSSKGEVCMSWCCGYYSWDCGCAICPYLAD